MPLWALFLGAQLVDVFWALFVWTGIEKVRIVPGFTASVPLDLYYMPYTHSVAAAVAWATAGFVVYRLFSANRNPTLPALLFASVVASHWVADFLVHVPDLPLYDDTAKMGLGLWNYRWGSFALEIGLLVASVLAYLAATRARTHSGRHAPWRLVAVLVVLQIAVQFGPPPASTVQVAVSMLILLLGLAWIAGRLDRVRA